MSKAEDEYQQERKKVGEINRKREVEQLDLLKAKLADVNYVDDDGYRCGMVVHGDLSLDMSAQSRERFTFPRTDDPIVLRLTSRGGHVRSRQWKAPFNFDKIARMIKEYVAQVDAGRVDRKKQQDAADFKESLADSVNGCFEIDFRREVAKAIPCNQTHVKLEVTTPLLPAQAIEVLKAIGRIVGEQGR